MQELEKFGFQCTRLSEEALVNPLAGRNEIFAERQVKTSNSNFPFLNKTVRKTILGGIVGATAVATAAKVFSADNSKRIPVTFPGEESQKPETSSEFRSASTPRNTCWCLSPTSILNWFSGFRRTSVTVDVERQETEDYEDRSDEDRSDKDRSEEEVDDSEEKEFTFRDLCFCVRKTDDGSVKLSCKQGNSRVILGYCVRGPDGKFELKKNTGCLRWLRKHATVICGAVVTLSGFAAIIGILSRQDHPNKEGTQIEPQERLPVVSEIIQNLSNLTQMVLEKGGEAFRDAIYGKKIFNLIMELNPGGLSRLDVTCPGEHIVQYMHGSNGPLDQTFCDRSLARNTTVTHWSDGTGKTDGEVFVEKGIPCTPELSYFLVDATKHMTAEVIEKVRKLIEASGQQMPELTPGPPTPGPTVDPATEQIIIERLSVLAKSLTDYRLYDGLVAKALIRLARYLDSDTKINLYITCNQNLMDYRWTEKTSDIPDNGICDSADVGSETKVLNGENEWFKSIDFIHAPLSQSFFQFLAKATEGMSAKVVQGIKDLKEANVIE